MLHNLDPASVGLVAAGLGQGPDTEQPKRRPLQAGWAENTFVDL